MNIIVVGINHKTAPIAIREKFYCTPAQQELVLSDLKSKPSIVEALILSTCNRTEIYCHVLNTDSDSEIILKLLFDIKGVEMAEALRKHFYVYRAEGAVRHFLAVATGLDSLVLGEKQVLGQVKEAVALAAKKTMLGKYFNILTNIAIRTGKKAQSETQISFGGCSISWAAVVMAERILETLMGKTILIMGAGKMGELAVTQMQKKGVANVYVMNRTESCALALAQRCSGEAVSFADIKEILTKVDLCICSVGAPHYILEKSTVERIMPARRNRKLAFIDISMPRNIDPQVAAVDDVLLFHLDDLHKVVDETMSKRQLAITQVEGILLAKTQHFYAKIAKLKSQSSDFQEVASQ